MSEHIGPSLWHSREINSCTRCKYLRTSLRKSGRDPDYEFFCMHPEVLAEKYDSENRKKLLEKVREKHPSAVPAFEASMARYDAARMEFGLFISNDRDTPETPDWCPVVVSKNA